MVAIVCTFMHRHYLAGTSCSTCNDRQRRRRFSFYQIPVLYVLYVDKATLPHAHQVEMARSLNPAKSRRGRRRSWRGLP